MIINENVNKLRNGELIMRSTWICMTKDLGVHNNAFGGILMSHVDEIGKHDGLKHHCESLSVRVRPKTQSNQNNYFKSYIKKTYEIT